ncbi:CpaF family protein [Anaerobutyricum hallii]|nr:ATPase, T2SS/T4P/T4SS family [Anaerobutyricum hallii]
MELPGKRELREQILHQMDGRTSYVSDKDVYREIDKAILRSSHGGYGTLSEKEELRRQMFYSIRGFDVLEKYLGDSSISEIMVIGASRIFVEQNGKIRRIEEHFSEEGDVYRLIEQIVSPTNRMVNEACPIVDSRLPDGSRVHIVLPPVSLEGPVITIRKFLKGGMTIEKLLAFEEFPEKLTGILSALVKSRYNILISGATNSGKSSLLNALAEYIGKRERVITIEDSAELQLFHVENLVRLETRNANMEGENEITMQDLIKASLRMRPDRIIVGEVRGAEAMSMLQALSTGHSGSVSSIHANSCRDALRRLETMVLMGMDMPLAAIQGLIASSVDILIHLGRLTTGKRKILEICEIKDYSRAEYDIRTLFQYKAGQTESLEMTGKLFHTEKLKSYGQYENYCEAVRLFCEEKREG